MEREILDLLILTRAYLEFGWCRGAEARDAAGNPCLPHGPAAVRWCVVGALRAAFEEVAQGRVLEAMGGACNLLHTETPSLDNFNDSHGYEDVLALIDRACARLGKG